MSKQSREVRSGLAHPKNHVSKRLLLVPPKAPVTVLSFRARIEHAPRRALIPSTRTRVPPPRVSPSNTRQVRASAASEHPGGALSANAARRARLVPTETTPRGALFDPSRADGDAAAAERTERGRAPGRKTRALGARAHASRHERRLILRRLARRADRPPPPKRQAHDTSVLGELNTTPSGPKAKGKNKTPAKSPHAAPLGVLSPNNDALEKRPEQAREAGERDAEALVHRGAG